MNDQPNILLIVTDQHRLSAVGAYRDSPLFADSPCQTPNIDRLAAEGIRFDTVYTTCPVCSPARGSIITGQYPHTHGISSNAHNLGASVHELPDGPDLAEAGRCACDGSGRIGSPYGPMRPMCIVCNVVQSQVVYE